MSEMRIYQEQQLLLPEENLLVVGSDAKWLLNDLDDEVIRLLCLRRGMIAEPRTVEVTAEIVQEREFRYGWSGQLRERCAKRTERIIKTGKRLKLWHTKTRGWYWIIVKS